MAEEVLRRWAVSRLGYGVQDEDEEQLQAVGNQDLSLVLKDDVVVWHAPCCGVVFEGLRDSVVHNREYRGTHGIEQRAEDGQNDLLVGTGRNVGDSLNALDWQHARRHVHGLAG